MNMDNHDSQTPKLSPLLSRVFSVQLRTEPEDITKHLLLCIMLVVGAKEEASVRNIYEEEQKITEINGTGR